MAPLASRMMTGWYALAPQRRQAFEGFLLSMEALCIPKHAGCQEEFSEISRGPRPVPLERHGLAHGLPTWLGTLGAKPGVCINELNPLQVLKTRIFSLVCIVQILDLQGQGGEFLDEAFALVEAATKPVVAVAVPRRHQSATHDRFTQRVSRRDQVHPRCARSRHGHQEQAWKPRPMWTPAWPSSSPNCSLSPRRAKGAGATTTTR